MVKNQEHSALTGWRRKLHDIIFEAETPAGKAFDVALLLLIVLSVLAVLIDSVPGIHIKYGKILFVAEWIFTILFSIEYILRIYTTFRPGKYIFSFYGIIDLLAILPSYLSLVFTGSHYLLVIRMLRLLRVFRVLKLARYVGASHVLAIAMKNSRHKIVVFLEVVVTMVVIMGSLMYLIEGPENGFKSIPLSIYWAIVTLTTVGYGDIAPQTIMGQALASVIMIIGYAIIAVPTGIISVEMARAKDTPLSTQICPDCHFEYHDEDAVYCKKCGSKL
ncbi:MAG TPA: ion transporter [Bacteroidales bacterium]|nr:ion transporter [Bacteroidales bacterium]HRX98286.1 ion transporter [Bacteroidales bacterium]